MVVPVLDESARATALCQQLNSLGCPSIVVDGGSADGTYQALRALAGKRVRVTKSGPGRARQMNFGAALADTAYLLFLHADGVMLARNALDRTDSVWGRFDVSFDSDSRAMKIIAWSMNQRSALTGICTGDQAIFTTAQAFESAGRYPEIALMEDIELSRRLLKLGRPTRIRTPVVTASRRWHQHGVVRTVVAMWWFRLLYAAGVPADALAKRCGHAR